MNEIRASQLPLRYCMKCNKELNWSEREESTCKNCFDKPQPQVSVEPVVINTPEKFAPTLAEITKQGELGKEGWWEVVYHDGANWQHFAGSDTFEDGEKVVKWKLCRECL